MKDANIELYRDANSDLYNVKLWLYDMILSLMDIENPTTTQLDMLNQAVNWEQKLDELDALFGYYACYSPEMEDNDE